MDIKSPFNACMHREYCQSEIDRLRAEVLSLQKENASLKESLANAVNADWHNEKVESITQQLAAANGRVEVLRGTLASVKGAIDSMPATAAYDFLPDGLEEEIDAALSNLNEDSAG